MRTTLTPTGLEGGYKLFRDGFQSLIRDRGSVYAVIVSAIWGVALVFDKQALSHSTAAFHGFMMSLSLSIAYSLLLMHKRRWSSFSGVRNCVWACIIATAAGLAGYLLQLHLIQIVHVGIFEATKRSLGVVFSVLSGYAFFHEELSRRKVGACVCMAFGVVVVVLG